jgi:endonuclease/exonuclease/phosphatase family metal-dependent hydrolase
VKDEEESLYDTDEGCFDQYSWHAVLEAGFTVRYRALANALTGLEPDVVQCQEVFTWCHLRLLRRELRGLRHLAFRRSFLGPAGGLVTFSQEPLAPGDYVRLRRPTKDAVDALSSRLTLRLRGTLATVHQSTGVTLLNAHTSADSAGDWSPRNRFAGVHRAQLSHLAEIVNAASRPVLMMGDLNTAADSLFYREFCRQLDAADF